MKRLKHWLFQRFLPEYCRRSLLEENARLREELDRQRRENQQMVSYIQGMEAGLRAQRRITINNLGKEE